MTDSEQLCGQPTPGILLAMAVSLAPLELNDGPSASSIGHDARRQADLESIREALGSSVRLGLPQAVVAHGDSLDLIRRLPDASVSLILTDPPYHATKKSNIYGDTAFEDDSAYLEWMIEYAREFRRVLKPNGGLYLFCAAALAARLEVMVGEYLKPLNHITWTKPNDPGFDGWKGKMRKEALRRWYPHSERILFFEQAQEGHVRRSTLGRFLRDARERAGLSGHALTEAIGEYGAVNHGGAVSNWETGRNIPSPEQYRRVAAVLEATGRVDRLPAYEDVVRPFSMRADLEFTDVWTFPSVRPCSGKHPAEKPLELLRHAIEASTYEGDIVLDCFAGSGSTAVAAVIASRRAVTMEIEERWVDRTIDDLDPREVALPFEGVTLRSSRSVREPRTSSRE